MSNLTLDYKLSDIDSVIPFGYLGELFLVQMANSVDDKEGVNALLTEELVIKNAAKQGLTNNKVKAEIALKAKKQIAAFSEVGDIATLVINHAIKGGKDHKVLLKIPPFANYGQVMKEYDDLPASISLKNEYSLGLQRRLLLEQVKTGEKTEWINLNYIYERKELKKAIEGQISLNPNKEHLLLRPEDVAISAAVANSKGKADEAQNGFLNDIVLSALLQLLLSQKQSLIRKEYKNPKKEELKEELKGEMVDPLYKYHSSKPINKDSWTIDNAVIEYAKQEVCKIQLINMIVAGDPNYRQAAHGEDVHREGNREGLGPGLHRAWVPDSKDTGESRELPAAHGPPRRGAGTSSSFTKPIAAQVFDER
jgi:hypothetical protein